MTDSKEIPSIVHQVSLDTVERIDMALEGDSGQGNHALSEPVVSWQRCAALKSHGASVDVEMRAPTAVQSKPAGSEFWRTATTDVVGKTRHLHLRR